MGGGYDLGEDLELSNLPEEAFDNASDVSGPFEPNNRWLKDADTDQQRIALRGWFLMRYCDPVAVGTPHNKELGFGFVTANAGPFDAGDELRHRFGAIVDAGLISGVAFELSSEGGEVWASKDTRMWDDYFDPRFGLEFDSWSDPNLRLQKNLSEAMEILDLKGGPEPLATVRNLVFFSLISALEAYLWETAVYLLENDPKVPRDFITKVQRFQEKDISLRDVLAWKEDEFKTRVKGYLQAVIWHKEKTVSHIFSQGLGLKFKKFGQFSEAIKKRHDIVHRSGRNKDGVPVHATINEVKQLHSRIHEFTERIHEQVKDRFQTLEQEQG